MGVALTQDSYRLWARIGYIAGITNTNSQVAAQLAFLLAESILNEQP
jgi:hypothetical protein